MGHKSCPYRHHGGKSNSYTRGPKLAPVLKHPNCLTRTHGETFQKYLQIKPESDCIYHAPIDLEPNGRTLGSKSIEK